MEKDGSLQERICAGCGETDLIGKLSATSGSWAGAFNMSVPDDAVGIASVPVEPMTCQFLDKAESAVQGKRQAGLTVACGTSLDSLKSRFHRVCLTHNSRIHSSHLASHARARSSVVSVTGDCCARFPRSFAAVVAADVAMPDACVNGRSRGSRNHAFNSGGAGGLLPVCKSTSSHLDVCSQGPTGRKRVKGGVSRFGRRFAPCLRGGGRGKFSAGRLGAEAGCRFTSREATRHWYQAKQGKCGHTFPPPGGSWYPIRVTWTRIGHQAIDGLDEGVWNRTVGDLGAKGYRQDLYVPCQS